MKNKMTQRGYTAVELIFGVFAVASLICMAFTIYALVHFIAKYW